MADPVRGGLSERPMRGRVLGGGNLLGRFEHHLSKADAVDIATAWAAPGEHLRALDRAAKRGVTVRAIVGTWGSGTHPDALQELSRIADGNLRIVWEANRLFHPKLYLFHRRGSGREERHGWIGSANFTRAGFGGHSAANEEIVLEVGPGDQADELAYWFQERWDRCRTDSPVSEETDLYAARWERYPPDRQVRQIVYGPAADRKGLLAKYHRPLTFEGYWQALAECEERLSAAGMDWGISDYMAAIGARQELLRGAKKWGELDDESTRQLKGSDRGDLEWWALLGPLGSRGKSWAAVCDNQGTIMLWLDAVRRAPAREFPGLAFEAMRVFVDIRHIGPATATLLLTLTRPDRLVSLNGASKQGLGALSGMKPSTLGKPENYRDVLRWLYRQPWYNDGPPADEALREIWAYRAALVDAFVYQPT